MRNTTKIASGVLVGTVIGATLGLLFAPKKGSRSRTIIADKAKELSESVSKTYADAKEKLGVHKNKVVV